jgi:putative hemolysin
VAACLGLSFVFSGMEAGVFALSRLRVRQFMRAGQERAAVLHRFLEEPENFLWTILVGNTLANFFAVALLTTRLHHWANGHPGWFAASLLGLALALYAFCDLLPKTVFRIFPNRLCLFLARPFSFIHLGLAPLVALVELFARLLLRWTGGRTFTGHLFGNRDELRQVMQESAQRFSSEERAMINRVLDLQNVPVRQIAVPLERAVTVTVAATMADVLRLCREHTLTRLPVTQSTGGQQKIIGLVGLDSVIYESDAALGRPVGDFVKPALYLDADVRLEVALKRLQRGGQRLAIVLDASRREVGLVSLHDITRFIFGEVGG